MILKDKIAVVTGAGGGIGSELVKLLRKEGVKLILIEKDLSLLDHLGDLLDGNTDKYECDLSDVSEITKLSGVIAGKYPKIDLLFNVAGIGIYNSIEGLSISDWMNSYAINVHTPFILTKNLITSLKSADRSLVLNIGSGMGKIGVAGRSAYCSTKFALRGMTLSLSKEYEGGSIDFCLLTLGSVMTPFGTGGLEKRKELSAKGKNYLRPEEVAKKIIEIVSDDERKEEYEFYPEGYES